MYAPSNNKIAVVIFGVWGQNQQDKARFGTDCYLRNLAVYKKQTVLRNIKEWMELVGTYTELSKIDLPYGYFNIRVEESFKKWNHVLTICSKMRGHVMSQEDCNALDNMLETKVSIFKNVAYQCIVMYIDEIIIYSETCEEHVRDLKIVLRWLEEQKVYFKESKYQFFTRKLEIIVYASTSD